MINEAQNNKNKDASLIGDFAISNRFQRKKNRVLADKISQVLSDKKDIDKLYNLADTMGDSFYAACEDIAKYIVQDAPRYKRKPDNLQVKSDRMYNQIKDLERQAKLTKDTIKDQQKKGLSTMFYDEVYDSILVDMQTCRIGAEVYHMLYEAFKDGRINESLNEAVDFNTIFNSSGFEQNVINKMSFLSNKIDGRVKRFIYEYIENNFDDLVFEIKDLETDGFSKKEIISTLADDVYEENPKLKYYVNDLAEFIYRTVKYIISSRQDESLTEAKQSLLDYYKNMEEDTFEFDPTEEYSDQEIIEYMEYWYKRYSENRKISKNDLRQYTYSAAANLLDDPSNEVIDKLRKLAKEIVSNNVNESLTEAIKPFVDNKIINSIRRYEMYHLPDFYTYADVDKAMRVDQIGTSSGGQPHDIIKATVCYITPDNEEEYAEHKYKVFDDGKVEAISDESLTEAKNDTLNPAIWDESDELKPEVKEKLEQIANKFIEQLETEDIPLDVDDIIIVGSNANYNYGPQSDIDLHIVADLSQFKGREKELAEKIYQAKKTIFNDKYDPVIRGFDVEIYVEPAEDKNKNEIPDEIELEEELSPIKKGTTIVELKTFIKQFKDLDLTEEDLDDLKEIITEQPPEASLGADIYKFRWSSKSWNKGQSGGARVIYILKLKSGLVYLALIYKKNQKEDLLPNEIKGLKKLSRLLDGGK